MELVESLECRLDALGPGDLVGVDSWGSEAASTSFGVAGSATVGVGTSPCSAMGRGLFTGDVKYSAGWASKISGVGSDVE